MKKVLGLTTLALLFGLGLAGCQMPAEQPADDATLDEVIVAPEGEEIIIDVNAVDEEMGVEFVEEESAGVPEEAEPVMEEAPVVE